MNMSTKQNLLAAIEAADQHTQEELLRQLEEEFMEKANQISHLLNSEEGTRIYWNSYGERFDKMQFQRLILQVKMYTLYDVCEKLYRKRTNR